MQRLSDYFGPSMIILHSEGYANIVIFRSYANKYLKLEEQEDDQMLLSEVSKKVVCEIKNIQYNSSFYEREVNAEILKNEYSATMLNRLSKLSPSLDFTATALLIGSNVTSAVMKRTTTIQMSLSVFLREKQVIDCLHNFKVCSSCKEFL